MCIFRSAGQHDIKLPQKVLSLLRECRWQNCAVVITESLQICWTLNCIVKNMCKFVTNKCSWAEHNLLNVLQ